MKKFLFLLFIFISTFCFGIDNQLKIDSLINLLPSVKSDSSKANLFIEIAKTYKSFETDSASKYCEKALIIAGRIDNKNILNKCYLIKGLIDYRLGNTKEAFSSYFRIIDNTSVNSQIIGKTYVNIGNAYADLGKYDSSIVYYDKAATAFDAIDNKKYKAAVLNNIGTIYSDLGDFDKAIEYYANAFETHEEYGNQLGKAAAIENIGIIYYYQENYNKALEYFEDALIIFKKEGVLVKEANALNNIASIAMLMGNKESSIEYFKEAEILFIKINDKSGLAEIAQNLSQLYFHTYKPKKGLESLMKALKLYKELESARGEGKCYLALGEYFYTIKDYPKSIENLLYAKGIIAPLKIKTELRSLYQSLANVYLATENYKQSSNYFKKYIAINDSIFNIEKSQQITEMQEKYDSESKQREIELQQVEIEKQNAAVKFQTKQKIWYGIGLILALVLLGVAYKGYQHKKQANEVITNQKHLVEEKNKEITASISYAKRLQEALLPSVKEFNDNLPNSFILFKPKDIVSGDFYWMEHVNNLTLFAVADCTGHGVPGAMVSVVCINALNRSVREFGITEPAKILDKTRELVIETFKKSNHEVKDGMDISLGAINVKTNELQWAGANNPVYIIREKSIKEDVNSSIEFKLENEEYKLCEIKANREPIGKYADEKSFTNHKFQLQKGDEIILSSDGYPDQFGGEKGKKFKYKPFKKLLLSIQGESTTNQMQILDTEFENWRGDLEQVDDVCVIGVRV